jgi:hypothetical protein
MELDGNGGHELQTRASRGLKFKNIKYQISKKNKVSLGKHCKELNEVNFTHTIELYGNKSL